MRRLIERVVVVGIATFVLFGCGYKYPEDPSSYESSSAATEVATEASSSDVPTSAAVTRVDDSAEARAICAEGSIAECEAACDGGKLAACVSLAQMMHAGTRVPADPDRASRILLRACDRGRSDACLQRGIWMQATDANEAAELYMRACDGPYAPNVSTTTSCALWMNLLDAHAYAPSQDDVIAGLSHVCELEEKGTLVPGSTITNGGLTLRYRGGACGRLKDLGMGIGASMTERVHAQNDAPPRAPNPAAPKW